MVSVRAAVQKSVAEYGHGQEGESMILGLILILTSGLLFYLAGTGRLAALSAKAKP